jgi:uncharacterized membrane protein HdeD (DUF308 family)
MRAAILLLYVVMAGWLMLAGVARIAIQLSSGQNLDALPFVGGGIGLLALVLLLPAWDDRRNRTLEERSRD